MTLSFPRIRDCGTKGRDVDHGAIIAREYGLPCVTGVPNVTSLIHTGDAVTVDGFLGIVIIG